MRTIFIFGCLGWFGVSSVWGQAPAPAPSAGVAKLSLKQFTDWVYYNEEGWIALQNEDLIHAETMFGRAIETARTEAAYDPRLMARSYADLAWVLHRQGRDAEAEPLARWALTVREALLGANSAAVAQTSYTLGAIQVNLNRFAEAEPLFAKVLAITESTNGRDELETVASIDDLAMIYVLQRKYDKARPLYQRSIAIRRKVDPESIEQVGPIEALAGIDVAEGKLDAAATGLQRARELIDKHADVDSGLRDRVYRRQAEVARAQGRTDEASRHEAQADELLKPAVKAP